jgi:hypothetical protein
MSYKTAGPAQIFLKNSHNGTSSIVNGKKKNLTLGKKRLKDLAYVEFYNYINKILR